MRGPARIPLSALKKRASRRILILALATLVLSGLACSLPSAVAPSPTPTPIPTKGAGARVPAGRCDASTQVAFSGDVQWTLPGVVDRKCYQDLTVGLTGNPSRDVAVYVHEVVTGFDARDRWISFTLGPDQSGGGLPLLENYWYSDGQAENTEYIAVYADSTCNPIGLDPARAGVAIVPIASKCP